jgi:hypothetical protein
MVWKKGRTEEGHLEYFNPKSRLRIQLKRFDSSPFPKYYKVFIYRKRKTPPKSGSAPTYHRNFDDGREAIKLIDQLLKIKNLNFNYLNNLEKRSNTAQIKWYWKTISDFLINTAGIYHKGNNIWMKNEEKFKIELVRGLTLDSIDFKITAFAGIKPLVYWVNLGFLDNKSIAELEEPTHKKWVIDSFEKQIKKAWVMSLALGTIKETLDEADTPNYGMLPKRFTRRDSQLKEIEDLRKKK